MWEYKPDLTQKEEKLLSKIQAQITYCLYDQSFDGSEVIWLWGKETDVDDLMFDYGVPEKSQEKILKHLECPFCGFSDFEMGFRVGIKTQYDIKLEQLYSNAKRKYQQPFEEFETQIIATPYLGLKHPLGRKILRELKRGILEVTEANGKFYRARKADPKNYPFTSKDMMAPDLGIPSEGRYNHHGHSHFYISENERTAEAEVIQDTEEEIEIFIQEFETINPITNILDLSHELYEINLKTPPLLVTLFNFIEKRKNHNKNYKPDYYVPRFIADCAKDAGFNGIKYISAVNHNGFNIVLFNGINELTPIGDPKSIKTENYKHFNKIVDW